MTIGMLILSVSFVSSVFKPVAQMRSIKIKVGDFVSPPEVALDRELIMTLKGSTQISWSEVKDYKQTSEPVYYRLSIAGKEYKVNDVKFILDNELYPPGEHFFKVRACDQLNNCSDWSEEGLYKVIETTMTGDITNHFDHYQISNINSTNYWDNNYLELKIDNNHFEQMEFEYLTESIENLFGFDQTKLVVSVNERPIFIENTVQSSWQNVSLSLVEYKDTPVSIKFFSGNQGDRQFSSWVKIKNINFSDQLAQEVVIEQEIEDKLNDLGIINK